MGQQGGGCERLQVKVGREKGPRATGAEGGVVALVDPAGLWGEGRRGLAGWWLRVVAKCSDGV